MMYLAIDHGRSFDAWLARWKLTPGRRQEAKAAIILQASGPAVDGFVLGADLLGAPGVLASLARRSAAVWFGLADGVIERWFEESQTPLAEAVALAEAVPTVGFKVAFWADNAGAYRSRLQKAMADLAAARRSSVGGLDDPRFMLEPYRAAGQTGEEYGDQLSWLCTLDGDTSLKLSLNHGAEDLARYENTVSIPWYARSSGSSFGSLEESVRAAGMVKGFDGCVAGTALWGIDEGSPLDGTDSSFHKVFRDRVTLLAQATHQAQETDPHEYSTGERR